MQEVKDFNELLRYFEIKILKEFNKENKNIKDFNICCYDCNINYLLGINIDRDFKLKQLRTMYINQDEIQKVKEELKQPNFITTEYKFNQVGGKENSTHHKKGGCIINIIFNKESNYIEAKIHFRASVAPYNLYYDLIMLNRLFKELEFETCNNLKKRYCFNFDEIKGKLMQNFFYYISAGYYDIPKNFINFEYGQMMVDEYNKAELSNWKSIKRFYGKCNDAMKERKINE